MENPRWSLITRVTVAIFCLLLALVILFLALPVVKALMIAGLLAYLLDPLVLALMRRFRMKRALASFLIYTLALLIAASLPALAGTMAYSMVVRLGKDLLTVLADIQRRLAQPLNVLGIVISPENLLSEISQSLTGAITNIPGGSLNFLSDVTTNILWGMTVIVSLFYFLRDGPKIKPALLSLAPEAYHREFSRLLDEIDTVWSLFLRVQLLIFLILAILFILGSLLVVWLYQLGLLPFSTLGLVLTLILVYTLVQQVDNLWLRPQLLGHQLRLHPGLVLIGLLGGLALGGVFGALIAVPMMGSVKVIGYYIRCKLLDLPPWPDEVIIEPSVEASESVLETDHPA